MKRFFGLFLVVLLSVGQLTGCKSEALDEKDPSAQTNALKSIYNGELERNVTLRILENDTAIEQGYFKQLIDAFNEKYKDYGIVAVDANMDQRSNLADDGPYGYGPDVLYQANDSIMKYVKGKHIYPIPAESLESFSQIPENAWEAYKSEVDGKPYYMGVPVNVQTSMLFYRKDMLPKDWETNWDDNKNKVPDMVENWNALYKYSKATVESGTGKYGYMRSLYDVYFSSGFLFSYGGYIFGDHNTNPKEVGLSAGNAEVGANVLLKLASVMNEECIDDSITVNGYSKIADGTYFATMTTPDVYTLFIKELALEYEKQGMSTEKAKALAEENLVVAGLPMLPASGDLTEENPELIPQKAMGGINGYAISAYTKAPNASLAFVEFAASYEMIMKRQELLGSIPARSDAAKAVGGVSEIVFNNLNEGNVVVMPSITEMVQVWSPSETFFTDLAKDAFRTSDKKYTSLEELKSGLKVVDQQIYDAIHTLSN
ncbi:arabinogalactan oligomer/maltooligosaccharide transport system substrate-binding protein [Fontibacillus phaseoli]|uniref:Arabinogalactan oligomer/maltooligosaccharide transport system substrate-binding protein n=2 Tax=Fontibacillus phaseoli TaxID=1416533 RepID=A0A369B2J3_9BACL|nr:arabinogalactan oligomer/maltooligosaccharide transport system substrate-binding protein [Fontibacillus phaseoli]